MNLLDGKKIAIIGAGPGGLTLGRLLQLKGAEVNIYERDAHRDARPKGATLDLHEESGLRAIREAGLVEEFKQNYRPGADLMQVADENGVILFDDHAHDRLDSTRPEIDRGPLQQILLGSLTPETVKWGHHTLTISPEGDGWNIHFYDKAHPEYADLLIIADGANSKLRKFLTPVQARYSGVTIVEGTVRDSARNSPNIHQLLKGGKIFAMGDNKSLIISSKGDGSIVFYTGCYTHEDWAKTSRINFDNKTEVTDWFINEFKNWSSVWLELFENADTGFIPRPQYYMPFDQSWKSRSNLTILGDAAHVMPPYAGEGVNMAMLDAVELSSCLHDPQYDNLKDAISAYERLMLERSSDVTQRTMTSTEMIHSSEAKGWFLNVITGGEDE